MSTLEEWRKATHRAIEIWGYWQRRAKKAEAENKRLCAQLGLEPEKPPEYTPSDYSSLGGNED